MSEGWSLMTSVLQSTSLSTEVIQKSIEGENGMTLYWFQVSICDQGMVCARGYEADTVIGDISYNQTSLVYTLSLRE